MNRARLITSIPFWVLLVGSLAAGAIGLWLILGTLPGIEAGLADQTATATQVYAGPSWIVVGSVLLGAGVVGVFLTLALAAATALVPAPAIEVVEAIDWTSEEESAVEDAPEPVEPVVVEEPVVEEPTAPAEEKPESSR